MKTEPIEEILPQKPVEGLISLLSKLSFTLNEVINFGTKILDWDLKKKRNGKDKNIPSVFLRNSIELGDAISILIEKSSIDPAKILIRSLMENTFGLLYMIEKDEDLRAHSFLVCRVNKDIRYYKQFIENEDISKNFVSKFIKQEPGFKLKNHCNPIEIKTVIKAKEELLRQPIYDDVNLEYHRTCTKNKKRNNNPNWYSLYDGPYNFESLCHHLENTILYEFQYRKYSENVHVTNVMTGFVKSKAELDKADLIQIRDFKDCKEVFYNAVNILLDLYREFIKIRLPEKQIEYDNWYIEFEIMFEKIDRETRFIYRE
ncbi:DUF5677 domain-containing protein [Marixanthomonas ophiurae]|uniref:Uncharacterized protein n=1 Tax=Marixanthomonas ophiurae TaxID=387659 RepID=A0A3E1QDF5_9FLAO|nr:DUF5677 domain-containing protein [Marixanthomonas ophiurae]RFN60124.1 hypothetical protein DZ858_08800 [Marixanthomonas ophiurae]